MAYISGEEILFSARIGDAGSDIEVVQETGDSETAVMSQKATTEAIAAAASGSGSDKLYKHYIRLDNNNDYGYCEIYFSFISKSPTPITQYTLFNYVADGYGMEATGMCSCEMDYGYVYRFYINDSEDYLAVNFYSIYNNTTSSNQFSLSNSTIADVVKEVV